jgi:hypothetical protein
MAANGISTLATKELRQKAKLALAAIDRAATGRRAYLDITELPTQYSGNTVVDNPNEDGLILGRPWIATPSYPAGTVPFSEMNGNTNDLGDLEDSTAVYVSNGFTLNDPVNNGSAVVLRELSTTNDEFFDTSAYNSGYIWTATWATGSTYHTTPVAMYYELFQAESVTFWILDPSDGTFSTPVSPGTFKFPVVFTPGSTPTSFTN